VDEYNRNLQFLCRHGMFGTRSMKVSILGQYCYGSQVIRSAVAHACCAVLKDTIKWDI